ncbi:MAG TPA: pyridoxal phosphate-dependent aminotransferase [Acidimicrobiales bacterium]|nr:pyridoxal phosphate-dependent aminotransferase [Acidimicrobiales bacterium]
MFDFDRPVDRLNTDSVKWEYRFERGVLRRWDDTDPELGDERVIPLWVADMDFRCPEPVIEAIKARAEHGIFGYSRVGPRYLESVVSWMGRRQNWHVEPEWIVNTAGVVPALHLATRAFARPGEGVIVQPPVYYPFYSAVKAAGCELVANPLRQVETRYEMDFEDLEAKASRPNTTLALLCSPHNPGGRLWNREELQRFSDICRANDVLVVSDEIHGDLIMPGNRFVPYGTIDPRAVICTAASKTFNMAGMKISTVMLPDPQRRAAFQEQMQGLGMFGTNPLSIVATEAAYTYGEPWLDAVLQYIAANRDRTVRFISERIPEVEVMDLDATYLLWLDFREFGLDAETLESLMLGKAKLYLDEGHLFGPEGHGWERINLACPWSVLEDALHRIKRVVDEHLRPRAEGPR